MSPPGPAAPAGFLDLVRRRQSVRRYDPRPVPPGIIERCLEAARLAPSACNSQPWTFLVVADEPRRSQLAAAAFSGVHAMNTFAAGAPVLVAVVTGRSTFLASLGGRLRGVQYSLIDIGIACEHFVLQAAAEGVGTCWLGWFDERAVRRILGLPRRARVDIMLSVGYPADGTLRDKQRKTMAELTRPAG